jgi:hypothetical protein
MHCPQHSVGFVAVWTEWVRLDIGADLFIEIMLEPLSASLLEN